MKPIINKIILFLLFLISSFFLISSVLKERKLIITIGALLIFAGLIVLVLISWYIFRNKLNKREFLICTLSPLLLLYAIGFFEASTYHIITFVFFVGIMGYVTGFLFSNKKIKIGLILLFTVFSVIATYHFYFLPSKYFNEALNSFMPENKRLENIKFFNLDGTSVDSRLYRDKIIVLNFWFTGCIPCEMKSPAFAQLFDHYSNNSEVFFADVHVNTLRNTSIIEIRDYLAENEYPVSVFYDYDSYLQDKIGVPSMPLEIIIDKNLMVVSTYRGYNYYDKNLYLENRKQIIDSLIAIK